MEFSEFIDRINAIIWGIPGVVLIFGVGTYLTLRLRCPQLRFFPAALGDFCRRLTSRDQAGEGTSSFRALCTALAATVGTGNIAGVAGAIAIGGPGAVFWMWVSAFVGMATKFAESTLAVRFREKGPDGEYLGGTMYMIRSGLPKRWQFLGGVYSFLGLAAAFGVGNATQVNAVICAMEEAAGSFGLNQSPYTALAVGILLALVVVWMVSGGSGKIGSAAELLIPVVSGGYIVLCLIAIGLHWRNLGSALGSIVTGAFSPRAVTGGAVGGGLVSLRIGVSRGVFTNEAGMGTAAMAHGSARVHHPVEQGFMGIMEVFIDTIVICTMTALVILTSGVEIPFGTMAGAELTARALSSSFGPWVSAFLCACLCLFALATILGWGLYAGRCVQFLFGGIHWRIFALCQGLGVLLGALLETGLIWTLAETMNGLMAIPNLIVLFLLSPELVRLTREYILISHGGRTAIGGTYESFHQREPL